MKTAIILISILVCVYIISSVGIAVEYPQGSQIKVTGIDAIIIDTSLFRGVRVSLIRKDGREYTEWWTFTETSQLRKISRSLRYD